MGRICKTKHIARILQHHMLKAATGADERPALFAREPNALEGAGHTLIGAARRAPQRIEAAKLSVGIVRKERSWQPFDRCGQVELVRGMMDSGIGRHMGMKVGVVITDDADPHRGCHLRLISFRGSSSGLQYSTFRKMLEYARFIEPLPLQNPRRYAKVRESLFSVSSRETRKLQR